VGDAKVALPPTVNVSSHIGPKGLTKGQGRGCSASLTPFLLGRGTSSGGQKRRVAGTAQRAAGVYGRGDALPSSSALPDRLVALSSLFLTLSPALVGAARSEAARVFGPKGAPEDLITVHVRWGDKGIEVELVQIEDYIHAVERMIAAQASARVARGGVARAQRAPHIFLTTEDRAAAVAFARSAPTNWQIYTYGEAILQDSRVRTYSPREDAIKSGGEAGWASLVALLLALEAHSFVFTPGSNWSKLLKELAVIMWQQRKRQHDVNCSSGRDCCSTCLLIVNAVRRSRPPPPEGTHNATNYSTRTFV